MAEAEGRSAGKTAGVLASVLAALTLAGALGKDVYDRYEEAQAGRDRRDRGLEDDRMVLRSVSQLGKAVAEQHVQLMGAALLGGKAPAPSGDLNLPVRAALVDLKLDDHFQSLASMAGFDAYDRDLNRTVEAKIGVRARLVYQAQELSQESIEALALADRLEGKAAAAWLRQWSPNWASYRTWMGNDLAAFGLGFDLPATLDARAANRLRDFQGLVDSAIDDGRIRKSR